MQKHRDLEGPVQANDCTPAGATGSRSAKARWQRKAALITPACLMMVNIVLGCLAFETAWLFLTDSFSAKTLRFMFAGGFITLVAAS